MDLSAAFEEYEREALSEIAAATTEDSLEQARIQYLGKKQGKLKELQSALGKATPEERPVVGKRFNEVKDRVEAAMQARKVELARPAAKLSEFDLTLPGIRPRLGKLHPLTSTFATFKEIMGRFGFEAVDGQEIEDEHHNFDALNIPNDHPARDPLENFFLATACCAAGQSLMLRSQTSTVQIRTMEQRRPPIRIVSLGRVYRPDKIDATHSCMFHQMEGLMVGRDVTMAMLKSVLRMFATAYLGQDAHVRFRPSFFPFTEPSVEVDVRRGQGWLELGGAGMVDPNVLRAVGYDPEEFTGFAFGLGIERFCMMRHGITDIRRFYENDIRFLNQF